MSVYAGIDCGTQSTKVLLIDSEKGIILGESSAPHQLISDAKGKREQQPQWWIDALISAFQGAVQNAGINAQDIQAISISGQQHGLVVLDEKDQPLYPAKLWCDTETFSENEWLLQQLGGEEQCLERLGLVVATGYTASKIIWLKKHYPELWKRVAKILLPHDYLNYWLTGHSVMEYGDASGTGLLNIQDRIWDTALLELIDSQGTLARALPKLVKGHSVIGVVKSEIVTRLNLNANVLVASGSGDNMMGAIGTGNIQQGVMTMSLGTSGTLYAYADKPLTPSSHLIANFCSANNGWLPLVCTMNVTSATSLVQKLLDMDITSFNLALSRASIGASGMIMLPFFNGERVPALPTAKGSIYGLDSNNFTQPNLCRATVEGTTFGLRYGLDLFKSRGLAISQIRLIGGGAKSEIWRQIVADIMNCEVICLAYSEAAALGAAIQAALVHHIALNASLDESQVLQELVERFVLLQQDTLTLPKAENVPLYEDIYLQYKRLLKEHYLEAQQ